MSEALKELLARVEAASEAWGLLHETRRLLVPLTDETEEFHRRMVRLTDVGADLNAALALVERLYGPMWEIAYNGAGYTAELQNRPPFVGRHKSPALAVIIALLHALLQKDPEDG